MSKRIWIYDNLNAKLLDHKPDHDEWHAWIEGEDDSFRSDDGMVLGSDEFGPVPLDLSFGRLIARAREESEPCEAGTPGCCIDHMTEQEVAYEGDGCETW